MEEATLVDFNRHRGKQPKLVAIYPREGTFYSDSPFIVLDAPWVTATQRAGAHAFQRWLAQKITPDVAARGGFRPADPHLKALAPVDAAHGADPAQPRRVLGLPEPRVLARVKSTWRVDRKPANVLLVVDTSGSMLDEDKLVHAQQGLRSFLNGVSAQDRIGLTSFSTDINPLVPIGPIRDNRNRLQQAVDGLTPDGQTSLFDATDAAVRDVRSGAGPDHINAVVILTDGEDTNSSLGSDKVIADLRGQAEDPQRVRVFTIAYGSGASGSQQVLHDIAAASGGKDYTGSTGDITAVYRRISSFF
jgi:Ca-activated chloride channel family protein